jgi:hypothetical protein
MNQILDSCEFYPLGVALGQQGAEPQLGLFCSFKP